jgi:hypothetical protein
MNNALACFGEKTTAAVAGFVLVAVGVVFLGLGFTVLPVFGFIVAVPAFIGSFPLLRVAFKEACEYYGK